MFGGSLRFTKVTQLAGTWALSGENWGIGQGWGTDAGLIKGAQSLAHKIESMSGSVLCVALSHSVVSNSLRPHGL